MRDYSSLCVEPLSESQLEQGLQLYGITREQAASNPLLAHVLAQELATMAYANIIRNRELATSADVFAQVAANEIRHQFCTRHGTSAKFSDEEEAAIRRLGRFA